MTKKSHRPIKVQKLFIGLALFILGLNSFSQNEFVTTWKTDNPGTSNSTSITIPTTGGGYNYDVDWTYDGLTFNSESSGVTGNITHDFGASGTYTVAIRGTFPRIYFNCGGDKEKIISIDQWGTNSWTSMQGAFYCCLNLVSNATDTPNLTGVTDMSDMFWNAGAFNADLSSWDVSNVTNMSYAFGITAVTGNLSSWDVSNVTNMYAMFSGTTAFNGDISTWNVGKVTDMGSMFDYSVFNGDLSGWDVSNVQDMSGMFNHAQAFNGDISTWNVINVQDMGNMFSGATAFNGNISTWDVSSVLDMSGMFSGATAFNGDLSGWIVTNVQNMFVMFSDASAFNGDISAWDVNNVQYMDGMFSGATVFNGDLSSWIVNNVQSMSSMFSGASAFNGDLSGWIVTNVQNMSNMFSGATAFNADISTWDVSSVQDMSAMFSGVTTFDRDLGNWDISSVFDMTDMFLGVTLSTNNYDNTLIGWNTLTAGETQIPTYLFFNGGNSTYCNGETERLSLANDYYWLIFDGGKDCSGLGLDDYSLTSLRLYPNPTRYEFRIEGVLEKSVLEIYNLTGQLVKSEINYKGALVDISELSSEVYFVKISNPNGTGIKRLLKE